MSTLNALIKPHNALLALQYLTDYQRSSLNQGDVTPDATLLLKLVDLKRASTAQELAEAVHQWLAQLPLEAQQQFADWLIKHN